MKFQYIIFCGITFLSVNSIFSSQDIKNTFELPNPCLNMDIQEQEYLDGFDKECSDCLTQEIQTNTKIQLIDKWLYINNETNLLSKDATLELLSALYANIQVVFETNLDNSLNKIDKQILKNILEKNPSEKIILLKYKYSAGENINLTLHSNLIAHLDTINNEVILNKEIIFEKKSSV